MPRLATLPQIQRNMLLTRAVEVNDGAPRATLARPLPDATLAVVTSAGIHCRGDRPFGREDPSLRVIRGGLVTVGISLIREPQRWFWGETALGSFLRTLRDVMNDSDDELMRGCATASPDKPRFRVRRRRDGRRGRQRGGGP